MDSIRKVKSDFHEFLKLFFLWQNFESSYKISVHAFCIGKMNGNPKLLFSLSTLQDGYHGSLQNIFFPKVAINLSYEWML